MGWWVLAAHDTSWFPCNASSPVWAPVVYMCAYAYVRAHGHTCCAYIFTAGVLQSSGQDLGRPSPQCFPLPLGAEHVKLPLFLLRERLAIADLVKTEDRDKSS